MSSVLTSLRATRRAFKLSSRAYANLPPLSRPGPPPLPPKEQREFEELMKKAARPAADSPSVSPSPEVETTHPDARATPAPEFIGEVNPLTGERGGPKREPVRHNDWSHSGRVTDF